MKALLQDIGGTILFVLVIILALIAGSAYSQAPTTPQLHVVLGAEHYPGLPGLLGTPPGSADNTAMRIETVGTNKILIVNAEVVNRGSPWMPPSASMYFDFVTFTPAVRAFWGFTLSTTNGVVVSEIVQDARFVIWDAVPLVPGIPQYYGWWVPGISPGRAAIPALHRWSNAWLIANVPDGDYVLGVDVDPLDQWGQFEHAEVPVRITGFDVR